VGPAGGHLAQVVLDGERADEQPAADLRVGQPVAGQLHDLSLPRGQLAEGLRTIAGLSPVAFSSRRARSANASVPIASSR
jgi:hypothetical protein